MIDHQLVARNIIQAEKSIEIKKDLGLDWVYLIDHMLTNDMLVKIRDAYTNETNWQKVDLQEHLPRQSLPWRHDSVIEEIHIIFKSLEKSVSSIFDRKVILTSVNFWQDFEGYTIPPHIDNDRISIAVQIYLSDSDIGDGTEIYVEEQLYYKLPWVPNTGYILNNTSRSVHGLATPGTSTRQSLYVVYQ